MSIEAEITVTLAEAELTDEMQIALHAGWPERVTVEFTIEQAEHLAHDLIECAVEGRRAVREYLAERARDRVAHGFDVDLPRVDA